MRAIQMFEYGGPDVLRLVEIATPEPGPGEVRVKVAAVGVNPADFKWRAGWFRERLPLSLPHIPGYDLAGTVDAVGEGVQGLAAGDRVAVMKAALVQGAYAEYVVAPAEDAAKIPQSLDFARAAALPTPGLTGLQLIEEHLRPGAGALVLVTGAVGGVGRFATHLAKALGARVVAAVRARQAAEARALGADEVVLLGEQAWSGQPFDFVADTVGGPDVASLCRSLAPGGRIRTVSTTPIDPTGLADEPAFITVHQDRAQLERLARLVAAGDVPIHVARQLPLAQAAEAQRLVEAGGQNGKLVLAP